MKYLVNMSYDGSKYHGYQIQNNDITIEGELERVLSKIFNKNINTIGSSRTDKGVHAYNQYCHFEADEIDTNRLKHSMNSLLNKSIFIKNITIVNEKFHARYNVKEKEYIYKINMGEFNPIENDYVLQYNKEIKEDIIKKFINEMNGTHNFKSFTSDKENNNYERTIEITYEIKENILYLTFKSSGFLRYMIRNIVGLLIEINDQKKNVEDIKKIFNDEDRTSLGKCAEPCGLYLNKVIFENE